MRPPCPEMILESLAEALQTMAFISPEPAEAKVPPLALADCVSVRWTSGGAGAARTCALQLATSCRFGELLAVNILALEPGSAEAAQRSLDALQELCNITTGSLLARLCETPDETPEMGLPTVRLLPSAAAWEEFVSRPGTSVIMAEGHPMAIRMEENAL